jgi:outer membrane protein assembly factor BamB
MAYGINANQAIETIADDSIVTFAGAPNDFRLHICYSTKTGEQLWSFDRTDGNRQYPPVVASGGGVYVQFDPTRGQYIAYCLSTGSQLWVGDTLEQPWGGYSLSCTIAYNKLYSLDLAGYITAFDIKTGKRLWHFFSGNSGLETHYGDYAFYWGPLIADKVVFAATGDHSPNQPLSRGQKLFAVNADTGTHLWNITGMMAVQAIADGYLLAYNAYDNRLYCFGKGQTTMTVSVTKSQIGQGESVGITGTITDQSPAQKDSPCVSKDSMGAWIEYLLMQQAQPANVTGVPVKLQAVRSDGTITLLGQTISDSDGVFRFQWTPPDQDLYKIKAIFEGDDSYWSSHSTATLMVDQALTIGQQTTVATTLVIIASIIVILIASIIGALALRKRK